MTRKTHLFIALICGVLAAGCGSDSPVAPSSQSMDLAALLSQMSSAGISSYPGVSNVVPGSAASSAASITPSTCVYSATTQGFVCPTITSGGLTINESYWLYDALGHAQTALDAAATASVRTVTDVQGTPTIPAGLGITGTTTVSSHSDMVMSGLLSGNHTLNGVSTTHDSTVVAGQASGFAVADFTTTTTNVVLPSNPSSQSYPKSGTIAVDGMSIDQFGSAGSISIPIRALIAFNGTSIVTVTTTVDGSVTTCKVDLSGKTAGSCS